MASAREQPPEAEPELQDALEFKDHEDNAYIYGPLATSRMIDWQHSVFDL